MAAKTLFRGLKGALCGIVLTSTVFTIPPAAAAEKYVLTTIAYSGNVASNTDLENAIKTKDLAKLIELVADRNKGDTFLTRRSTITKNLNTHFKKALYRNIEND